MISALKKIKAEKCKGEKNAGNLNRGVKDILSKMVTFELRLDWWKTKKACHAKVLENIPVWKQQI